MMLWKSNYFRRLDVFNNPLTPTAPAAHYMSSVFVISAPLMLHPSCQAPRCSPSLTPTYRGESSGCVNIFMNA